MVYEIIMPEHDHEMLARQRSASNKPHAASGSNQEILFAAAGKLPPIILASKIVFKEMMARYFKVNTCLLFDRTTSSMLAWLYPMAVMSGNINGIREIELDVEISEDNVVGAMELAALFSDRLAVVQISLRAGSPKHVARDGTVEVRGRFFKTIKDKGIALRMQTNSAAARDKARKWCKKKVKKRANNFKFWYYGRLILPYTLGHVGWQPPAPDYVLPFEYALADGLEVDRCL
ncbi:hypothetical protein LTR37_020639 [Vermiconidia calcicola]|uniref:Uncharacterized protein n=1 Tax=Vermiconidia calcicola TaxID=1690605 RepID=A0ACC3MCL3_9PEZI|nr:hypothetical protein LTR37_020639 [Vermiconidia calcicola]